MKMIQKYKVGIIIGILVIVGICTVIWGKTMAVQGTITSVCWGVAVLIFAGILNKQSKQELEQFEEESNDILKDIASNGEESPYFGQLDIETVNKIRIKLQKKLRKQVVGCAGLGVVLLIIAIICII